MKILLTFHVNIDVNGRAGLLSTTDQNNCTFLCVEKNVNEAKNKRIARKFDMVLLLYARRIGVMITKATK